MTHRRTRKKRNISTAIALGLFSAVSLQSFAATIGVSFLGDGPQPGAESTDEWLLAPTEMAGVVPQANWNNIATPDGGDDIAADQGITGALRDSNGAVTRVQLRYAGNDAWNTSGSTDTADSKLMKGTLKRFDDQPLTLSITNLASGTYDVYVYGNVDGGPGNAVINIGTKTNYWSQPAAFDSSIGFYESNSTDPATSAEGNYVKFTGVAPVNGAINIQALYKGGGNAIGIAGLQLVSSGSFPTFQNPTALGAVTNVQNVAVYQGSEASFSFIATNNASPSVVPTTYQWYVNGQPVAGATGPHFTFLAAPGNTNAQVYAIASVPAEFNPNNLSLRSDTGTLTIKSPVRQVGALKVEFFPGATRQEVEAGNVGPAATVSRVTSFELPVNDGIENYTRRVSGYFIPAQTGDYVFFLSADDDSDLYLSTDADPAHKRLIAQESAWSNSRNWTTVPGGSASSPSQKRSDQWSPDGGTTAPYANGIHLEAAKEYYIEGVQHQGVGGDNFAVTYKLVSEADPADGDAPRLNAASNNIALVTSPTTTLAWQTQPTNAAVKAGQTVSLNAAATSDSEFPVQFQWFRNGTAVSNATTGTYTFPAGASDNNTQWYVVAKTADGSKTLTSGTVTVTVQSNNNRESLITFADQIDNDLPANPNPYTDAQGLPNGITMTLTSFNSWKGDNDHTPTADNYLLYGNGDASEPPSIKFNVPVEVPSLWVTSGPFGQDGVATLTGYLKGVEQFTYTIQAHNSFEQVTGGAGKQIDEIQFADFGDSEIDDITVVDTRVAALPILTFSDQVGNDVEANPGTYTDAQGLPTGVTATLRSFNNWNGNADHTATPDNILLYGNGDATEDPAILFNKPVEVPSLWVSTGDFGTPDQATLAGYLNGVQQWSYTVHTKNKFEEVTAGAGKAIDRILFTNYGDSFIDDVTVKPAPSAAPSLSIARNGAAVSLSWSGAGTLEQSDNLTSPNWQTAPSQVNPQTVSTSASQMRFFRVKQ